MMRPDDDVCVLPDIERADALIDPELFGRIERDHRERLVVAHVAPPDGLGGFRVEPARVFCAVGVDRDGDALRRHDRRVAGNRVFRFDLVAPPVGECRAAGVVRRDLFRHFVAFEHVLEGRDFEAHLLSEADHHQDFVGAIAVHVHEALALEDFDERVELEIAPGRGDVLAGGLGFVVLLPLLLIRLRAREGVADHELDALARRRVAERAGLLLRRGPFWVLAKRELDPRRRPLKDEILGLLHAPAKFDDECLAADRVRAAVKNVGHGEAAGQIALNRDVGGIEHVAHADHRAHRRRAFVDGVVRDVRVRVDDAGRDEFARAVDDVGARRNLDVRADGGDLAVAHEDGAVLDGAVRDGHDGRVPNRDDGRRGRARLRLGASDEDRSSRDRGGGQGRGGDGKQAQMSGDH
jgi:hypothetical protein